MTDSSIMSEGPGTELPWRVEEGTDLIWGACNPDDRSSYGMGYPIAQGKSSSWSNNKPDYDEREANAAYIVRACNSFPDLLEALEAAEAAIARVTEGDGGMVAADTWRKDGTSSKHDRCPHGRYMYEGCETCVDAVLDPVLDGIIRPALAKARQP